MIIQPINWVNFLKIYSNFYNNQYSLMNNFFLNLAYPVKRVTWKTYSFIIDPKLISNELKYKYFQFYEKNQLNPNVQFFIFNGHFFVVRHCKYPSRFSRHWIPTSAKLVKLQKSSSERLNVCGPTYLSFLSSPFLFRKLETSKWSSSACCS